MIGIDSGNKEKYRQLCLSNESMSIFSRDWWLDAVCGPENWDVIIVEKDDQIVASMPLFIPINKFGFKVIIMPKLTQTMGPWLSFPTGMNYTSRLNREIQLLSELIEKIPYFSDFRQNFHYSLQSWLPFYWNGYRQTTKYTYVIDNLTDLENVYSNIRKNIKYDIKKSGKIVKIVSGIQLEELYRIVSMTFKRQNFTPKYSLAMVQKIGAACQKNSCGKSFYAVDESGDIHAALYLIWDKNSAYYLMGGGNPLKRNSGAGSLMIWEAIKFVATVTQKFDFEGSMIASIEKYFRSFGAIQKPYFNISKTNSKIIKAKYFIKDLLSK